MPDALHRRRWKHMSIGHNLSRCLSGRRWQGRSVRAAVAVGAAFLLTLHALSPGPAQGKSKAEQTIDQLFDVQQPAVRDCALTHAIYKGATSVALEAKILVNREGRVFGVVVKATVNGGDKVSLQTCLSDVIRKVRFPRSGESMRQIIRTWQFATR